MIKRETNSCFLNEIKYDKCVSEELKFKDKETKQRTVCT